MALWVKRGVADAGATTRVAPTGCDWPIWWAGGLDVSVRLVFGFLRGTMMVLWAVEITRSGSCFVVLNACKISWH